ncbi:MAG: hypothetical protein Q8K90_05145, partial [Brevundimonas sp.]|nr:hypothetical protein [Brevundimonas sp.]
RPSIIRGNASEIMAVARIAGLTHDAATPHGVDNRHQASEAEALAEQARITTIPGLDAGSPPPGFANFDQWLSGTQLERELKIQEYSVSNRGLRPQLVGTPEQIAARVEAYEDAGLDLLLLQMSPQEEEMERFSAQIIRR